MATAVRNERNFSIGDEEVYVFIQELKDKESASINGCTIHSGHHPEHGNVHVVISSMGDARVLKPFKTNL